MNTEQLLKLAIIRIDSLPFGTSFYLKDLFDIEWLSLPKGEKLYFGKVFKRAVLNQSIPNTKYKGKADNNSAVYVRV